MKNYGFAMEEAMLETLASRGWRFRDPDEVRALMRSREASTSSSSSLPVDSIESELLSMDLRSIGGKSLPESPSLKKSSYLQGPKVLQVVSVRDIRMSSIDASFKGSQHNHRLLRFSLTDGHSEVIAIEYAPIPSISQEIIPGNKVRLENKIPIHSGILCLNPKVVTVIGGLVQSLYEEWQMSQKYSGFSRLSQRLSQSDDGVGPPPFEKLLVEAQPHKTAQHHSLRDSGSEPGKSVKGHEIVDKGWQSHGTKAEKVINYPKQDTVSTGIEDKPCSSEARPKEVSEAVPVQNQAAAQKLLQKMSQATHEDKHTRGHKHRFRGKQEETPVFTLDEWEKRKGISSKPVATGEIQDTSRDEELARQLQNQLNLEDLHGETGHTEAEKIQMSMFSFGGAEERNNDGRREFRGRGRGRGRGRRRFG